MGLIVFTTTRGVPEMDPIGCFITGSLESLRVDESFHEINRMMVQAIPLIRQHPCHPSQDMRCQMLDPDPWQDKKPIIISHEVKILFSRPGRPPDKPVPATDMAWS